MAVALHFSFCEDEDDKIVREGRVQFRVVREYYNRYHHFKFFMEVGS